jgi:hypothetical protein
MNRFLFSAVIFSVLLTMLACDCSKVWRSKPRVYSNSLQTPDDVVKAFCDLDAAGKRLSSLTWSEMLPYINWREEAMESVAVVISDFKVLSIKKADNVADIVVEYDVIGKYWSDKYEPTNMIEKVSFTVIKTEDGWKIKSPDTMVPHVFPNYMISHLERVLKEEKDVNAIKEIQKRILRIKKLENPIK